jgi:hypothetical protein
MGMKKSRFSVKAIKPAAKLAASSRLDVTNHFGVRMG